MATPAAPLLYEVATRPWLARLSARYGRRVTLGDIPDVEIERIASSGFDLLWPMGVWRTGAESTRIAREQPWLRERWSEAFPGGEPPEIVASPFAVSEYVVTDDLGGDTGLERLRDQLARARLGLVLDFVPHHTAVDAPWVRDHPAWYVAGSDAQRATDPTGYVDTPIQGTSRWIAHGRDPYFPPWSDTVALDYRNPAVHEAMTRVLRGIAQRCDGIRADMAMLVLDDVFRSTWTDRSMPPVEAGPAGEFWLGAIAGTRADRPGFLFIAEAYWGLEWRLQQLGFDYTYDKTFYDRLVAGDGPALAAHLRAEEDMQRHSVRFLENHDEARAAEELPFDQHRAGAVLAATALGMFLVQDGQLDGARFRSPVQFARRPVEPVDVLIRAFYGRLFEALKATRLRRGVPLRLAPQPAWDGNPTHEAFVAHLWTGPGDQLHLAVVNLGATAGQCRLPIAVPRLANRSIVLDDVLGTVRLERRGDELLSPGLFLDVPAAGYHLFRLR